MRPSNKHLMGIKSDPRHEFLPKIFKSFDWNCWWLLQLPFRTQCSLCPRCHSATKFLNPASPRNKCRQFWFTLSKDALLKPIWSWWHRSQEVGWGCRSPRAWWRRKRRVEDSDCSSCHEPCYYYAGTWCRLGFERCRRAEDSPRTCWNRRPSFLENLLTEAQQWCCSLLGKFLFYGTRWGLNVLVWRFLEFWV